MIQNVMRRISSSFIRSGIVRRALSTSNADFASNSLDHIKSGLNYQRFSPCIIPFLDLPGQRKSLEISMPALNRIPMTSDKIVEAPKTVINPLIDPLTTTQLPITDPTVVIEKKAARLITIRKKKMKKHKLKKLRIKMKFEWAKLRQRRELKREKEFQMELMGQIREAEKFDAVEYAREKIAKANADVIPKLWRGKRLPQFVIIDLLEKKRQKAAENAARIERRKTYSIKVSDYKV